jgi:nucleotide-binding universal stress UspA family protein
MEFGMYKRILITTDGSKLSKKAVTSGIALAASLDAEIVAFMAVTRYPQAYYEGAVVLAPKEIARIEKESRENAQFVLDKIREESHGHDVKAITALGRGPIAEGIIRAAKKYKCDLIVMASHGRKGIKRILLGSETLDVLTHSHTPVLVLR